MCLRQRRHKNLASVQLQEEVQQLQLLPQRLWRQQALQMQMQPPLELRERLQEEVQLLQLLPHRLWRHQPLQMQMQPQELRELLQEEVQLLQLLPQRLWRHQLHQQMLAQEPHRQLQLLQLLIQRRWRHLQQEPQQILPSARQARGAATARKHQTFQSRGGALRISIEELDRFAMVFRSPAYLN